MNFGSIENRQNTILIRADANERIGFGHIMRCLSLAQAFRDLGRCCVFLSTDNTPRQVVESRGFMFRALQAGSEDMEAELSQTSLILEELHPCLVIVDSYRVPPDYLRWLHRYVPVAYMDDVRAFAYPCDIVVNYNVYGTDWEDQYRAVQEPFGTKLILGPRYAPLREEFQSLPPFSVNKTVRRILVSTGGSDPLDIGRRFLLRLREMEQWRSVEFHVIVGALNPHRAELEQLARELPQVTLHVHVTRIAQLMCQSDMAIAAAGSTLYELCASGVPTITYVLADNQISGASAFERKQIMLSAGDCREEGFFERLEQAVETVRLQYDLRREMSRRAARLVDGKGANRLAEALLSAVRGE